MSRACCCVSLRAKCVHGYHVLQPLRPQPQRVTRFSSSQDKRAMNECRLVTLEKTSNQLSNSTCTQSHRTFQVHFSDQWPAVHVRIVRTAFGPAATGHCNCLPAAEAGHVHLKQVQPCLPSPVTMRHVAATLLCAAVLCSVASAVNNACDITGPRQACWAKDAKTEIDW